VSGAKDDDLFNQAMRDVERIADRDRVGPGRKRAKAPKVAAAPRLTPDGDDGGRVAGVNDRRMADLRGGQIAPDERLDMHGLRADDARAVLADRVRTAAERGAGCLLVIHGRGAHSGGKGVLPRLAADELMGGRAAAHVLAFCPAQPKDGGAGALYVLLRRRR